MFPREQLTARAFPISLLERFSGGWAVIPNCGMLRTMVPKWNPCEGSLLTPEATEWLDGFSRGDPVRDIERFGSIGLDEGVMPPGCRARAKFSEGSSGYSQLVSIPTLELGGPFPKGNWDKLFPTREAEQAEFRRLRYNYELQLGREREFNSLRIAAAALEFC